MDIFSPVSIRLSDITWNEAESLLEKYDTVVMALGAGSKEHGPHLTLGNDFILAERLLDRVADRVEVLILPTLNYGHYPAFTEYPISINLRYDTFRDVIVDIARSLAGFGVKKFYILNTGVSTTPPIQEAATIVDGEIDLEFLDLLEFDKSLPEGLEEQEGGTHADELETSMMLFLAPEVVAIEKAEKDYDPRQGRHGLTRNPNSAGNYSKTGVYGDPTLASYEKGEVVVNLLVEYILNQIQSMGR